MGRYSDPETREFVKAWNRLERKRRQEIPTAQADLRKIQKIERDKATADIKAKGLPRSRERAEIKDCHAELELRHRRELRDIADRINRERRERAMADSPPSVVIDVRAAMGELEPQNATELIHRLMSDGIDVLASEKARQIAQHIRDHGQSEQRRQLANAVAGIRRGRRKEVPTNRDVDEEKLMRNKKTEAQRRLLSLRRTLAAEIMQDEPRYLREVDREVLIPMGIPPEKRQTILQELSRTMPPVIGAKIIVRTWFHVGAPSRIMRLGRSKVQPKAKPAPQARQAQSSDQQTKKRVAKEGERYGVDPELPRQRR